MNLFFGFLCQFTKIKKNKIVFSCYGGNAFFGCNPKYITLELIKEKVDCDIVWILNEEIEINDDSLKNIKVISNKDKFNKFKELASAKVWIDNSFKTNDYKNGLFKKKNQIYINTWHGSFGIKKMYWDMNNFSPSFSWSYFFKKEINDIDIMLASSPWEEEIYKSAIGFKGDILKIGNPRNDIFFQDFKFIKQKVCNYFKIDTNKKILLYAPSFRDINDLSNYDIDYLKLNKVLHEKFGSDWAILTKIHINESNKIKLNAKKLFIDATNYPDMQELLRASDVLISDYSSCMFDFMLQLRPCFVFAKDMENFINTRGLYYGLYDTPFLVAKNNDELMNNILNFDLELYQNKCIEFIRNKKVVFDDKNSKRVVEILEKIIH